MLDDLTERVDGSWREHYEDLAASIRRKRG